MLPTNRMEARRVWSAIRPIVTTQYKRWGEWWDGYEDKSFKYAPIKLGGMLVCTPCHVIHSPLNWNSEGYCMRSLPHAWLPGIYYHGKCAHISFTGLRRILENSSKAAQEEWAQAHIFHPRTGWIRRPKRNAMSANGKKQIDGEQSIFSIRLHLKYVFKICSGGKCLHFSRGRKAAESEQQQHL